jgi:hypothetical protein
MTWLINFFVSAGSVALLLTVLALMLTGLGSLPRWLGDVFARAPALDLLIALFTWVPWLAAGVKAGWAGVLGALAGQVATYFVWVAYHETMHRDAVGGPRIVKVLNRIIGKWQNHAALWGTLIALPCFWHFRLIEATVYPFLVVTLDFPRYRHGDWVNVSRHKFEGLVGHDLFWCLYCDWMTGVTALGMEMLRNVESFWCPIRFYEGKKCENCKIDYPDVADGWVPADGTMREVTERLEEMYGNGRRTWFGHRARLTVRGEPVR